MNNNGFGNGPIRKYKKRGPSGDTFRTVAVLLMTAVIIAFVVVFIMSLTGTGMFADKKEDVPPVSSTEESSEPEQSEPTSSEDPNVINYDFRDMPASDLGSGLLQLINREYLYDFSQNELSLHTGKEDIWANKEYYEVNGSAFVLKNEAYMAFNRMAEDFYNSCNGEYKLIIIMAYRDFDTQKGYHDKNPANAVPPGASDFHSGATVEIKLWNVENRNIANPSGVPAARWITQNAHKYGFIFRAPAEKAPIVGYTYNWQLRYVGAPHAEYMYDNSLCLEEYLELLSTDHGYSQERLTVKSLDGNTYEVYYVDGASEGTLHLPVPENRPYTWSGDNVNGYIVTVTAVKGEPPASSGSSSSTSPSDPEVTD